MFYRFLYYWENEGVLGKWLIGTDYNEDIIGIQSQSSTGPVSPVSIRGWEYYDTDWLQDDSLAISPTPPEGQTLQSELVI